MACGVWGAGRSLLLGFGVVAAWVTRYETLPLEQTNKKEKERVQERR